MRSPIKLCTGRSPKRPAGTFSSSLQRADLAQPGIPAGHGERGNYDLTLNEISDKKDQIQNHFSKLYWIK